jgi:hypothetical protein
MANASNAPAWPPWPITTVECQVGEQRSRTGAKHRAHQLASQVGLRQVAKRLGIHRDAPKAAFGQWGLPALERRVGWQPSRFLADRGEAERAFALAERLGSMNAAAVELGTTWPSLRKAFARHELGMPARNAEAVRQRAIDAARQRSGRPSTPSLDPVFVLSTATNCRYGRGRVGSWPSGSAAPRTTRPWARVVVELHSESHATKPSTRAWAITRRADRSHRLAGQRASRAERRQAGHASRTDRPHQPHQQLEERGMVADAR